MNVVGRRTLKIEVEQKARTVPGKTFLMFESVAGHVQSFTYREFDERVNRTAQALRALGVGKGDKVNIHLVNCPEFLLVWFGTAKLGAVMVPTSPQSTPDEMAYLLADSESRVAVTEPGLFDAVAAVRDRCPGLQHVVLAKTVTAAPGTLLFDDLLKEARADPPGVSLDPTDEAAMLYTSGTTSKPKGCLITHVNYLYGAEAISKATRLGPDDRHLVVLPLFHAGAQMHQTVPSLLVGGSLALMERFSASRYLDQAIRYDATASALFAAPIRMILAQPRRPEHRRNRLRVVTFAQNVTEAQLDEWDERFGAPLMQLWGMTETASLPVMNPLDAPRKNMTIGLPVLGYDVRIVNDRGEDVPPGTVGELIVRGEPGWTLMKGYFKNPEATATTIRDGWLYSGDQVRQDEEGYISFVDRSKDLIKRAGENISTGEVEAVLKAHPRVFDAAVIGIPDPVYDEAIKGFIVVREGESVSADELIVWCAERLSRHKIPSMIEFRDSFPRTSVGKIQKHLLRQGQRTKDEG